jgi:hypothetical protein
VKAKSFGSNFNKNLAGIFVAREGCLGVARFKETVITSPQHPEKAACGT